MREIVIKGIKKWNKSVEITVKADMKSYIPLETAAIFFLANLFLKQGISALSIRPPSLIYKRQFKTVEYRFYCAIYSYIVPCETVFSFCHVFSIVVI